jgi:hypothetical protein
MVFKVRECIRRHAKSNTLPVDYRNEDICKREPVAHRKPARTPEPWSQFLQVCSYPVRPERLHVLLAPIRPKVMDHSAVLDRVNR